MLLTWAINTPTRDKMVYHLAKAAEIKKSGRY
jgi:hypothetical protein